MNLISTVEEAKAILVQDKNLMIRMGNDFNCWIQMGLRDEDNNLVANGRKVAQLTKEVFDALIPELDQAFFPEYFQPA